ncbi:hypothetical protein [Nocardia salmonicida]|uniref:hypothetical protein n=1 Tax=Nocardia salmonicida TaxID=53431 RepID=UPI0037B0BE0C
MSEAYERMQELRRQRVADAETLCGYAQRIHDARAERTRERMYDLLGILDAEGIEAESVYTVETVETQDRPRSLIGRRSAEKERIVTYIDHGWRLSYTRFLNRIHSDYDPFYPVLTREGDLWTAVITDQTKARTEIRGLTHGHAYIGHPATDTVAWPGLGRNTPVGDLDEVDLTAWYLAVVDELHRLQQVPGHR